MRTLSIICVVLGAVALVVACISRILLVPVPLSALPIESQAIGQLASILFLFAIALNTMPK